MKVKHSQAENKLHINTETVVVGIFEPEKGKNTPDYFYSGSKNFLWKLVPGAFDEPSLKGLEKEKKLEFLHKHRIGFIDLVAEVEVDNIENFADHFIDSKVTKWRDVISEINALPKIRKVCLTRKNLDDVPQIKKRVDELIAFCKENRIKFEFLPTPARIYNEDKQAEWTRFFNDQKSANKQVSEKD